MDGNVAPRQASSSKRFDAWGTVVALLPLILGLGFARAALVVSAYDNYRFSDEGFFSDGSMVLTLVLLLVPFVVIAKSHEVIPKRWVNRIARVCIVGEALSIFGIGALELLGVNDFSPHFALSVACSFFASGAMFYWLRRMRGCGTIAAVVFVFSALIVSELEMALLLLVSSPFDILISGVLVLAQLPFMVWARGRTTPFSREQLTHDHAFPGFDEKTLRSRNLLIAMAAAIGLLAIVSGFLRGFPDGEPIELPGITRLAYAAIVVLVAHLAVVVTAGDRRSVMPMALFVVLEIMACGAFMCYAAWPDALEVGAVFATALNSIMLGLVWYMILAFMSFGWRDPYYYALGGWFVWLGARAVTRVIFMVTTGLVGESSEMLAVAIAATIVVVSTQITLGVLLFNGRATNGAADQATQEEKPASTIVRIMGLDEGESLVDVRRKSMRHSAEIMGKQFLLSDREVDVLALYALGYTQKKVADELCIAQNTAHEHIKRIYVKTGLHSRQEILDYIAQYAS